MAYLPHTEEEVARLLAACGLSKLEDLVEPIPPELRLKRPLRIPHAAAEFELREEMEALAGRNLEGLRGVFLGAGAYSHYVPSAINHLVLRQEFLTAYTPYQAEIAQGTLTWIFEYQTMVCQLTGMEVANASLYDASTALAEACLMARRVHKDKGAIVVSRGVHPEYIQTARTFLAPTGVEVLEVPVGEDGRTDWGALEYEGDVAAICVQSPNFLGCIEDLGEARRIASKNGALLIAGFSEPLSLALLKPPGEFGADIVFGEGAGFGVPVQYGGPYVGMFATKKEYIRQMPGRLIGQTVDADGHVGYVMTLTTREQHIRREKATSNICTNIALMALRSTIYLCLMGKAGLRDLARQNLARAESFKKRVAAIKGFELPHEAPTFNEFVVRLPKPYAQVEKSFHSMGVVPGLPLARYAPERDRDLLVCITETVSDAAVDAWLSVAKGL
ncbi:MAG: aminomethyl-transferring glycine dehydrogenase subunit GcvPA [Candidatus Methylomirabilis sp.]|nr:aminomethyl-transferring glycine dehydrogenase subunit GcvPA [Deltaproteobacteria bacterium]